MRWKKLGKIFNPLENGPAHNPVGFAQSPQTLVFSEFIRIYYSTRKLDEKNGKYFSRISFIDIKKDLKAIINVSKNEIISLGELGSFDEHGIFPINIVQDKERIWAYTCGWSRRNSVSVETSTGLAISLDGGITFKKYGNGPILTASLNEPFLVGDSFVRIFNGTYHMWYIFGIKWINTQAEDAERVYKIGHAVSENGIDWKKEEGKQIISDNLNSDECQALPTVLFYNNAYHMFFCYREATDFRKNKNRGYRLGYAYSTDLVTWVRKDEEAGISLSKDGWDSEMMCYPHLFACDDKIYLLYNGNEFGKYGFGIAELEK